MFPLVITTTNDKQLNDFASSHIETVITFKPRSGKAFKSKTSKGSNSAKMAKRGEVQGIYFGG